MIPFLVKLANLLDTRGQYKMAREVDDLIEKLAQAYSDPQTLKPGQEVFSPFGGSADTRISITDVYNQLLEMFNKLNLQTKGDTGVDPKQLAQETLTGLDKVIAIVQRLKLDLPGSWKQVNETVKRQMDSIMLPIKPEQMPSMFAAAADAIRWFLTELVPLTKNKPQKKKPGKNPLISDIEGLLGFKEPAGVWTAGLNTIFITYMNAHHPDKMKNSKFQGSLKDAYNIIWGDKNMPQPETGTKLPKDDEGMGMPWTSKYYKITPNAITALKRLDEAHKGNPKGENGQQMINNIEQQALRRNPKNPLTYIDQSLFEEMLSERTKPTGQTLPYRS